MQNFLPQQNTFTKNKSNNIDGLFPYCKKCTISKSIKWGKNNPERKKQATREHLQTDKAYRTKRIYQKRFRDKGGQLRWQRRNREKLAQYRLNRETNKKHIITDNEWNECLKYFGYSCVYCGMSQAESLDTFGQVLHKDHVDNEGADDLSNNVPACKSCNSIKSTRDIEEFIELNGVDEERVNKIIEWIEDDYIEFIEVN